MDRYYNLKNVIFFIYFLVIEYLWNDDWVLLANLFVALLVWFLAAEFITFMLDESIFARKVARDKFAERAAKNYLYSNDKFTKVIWCAAEYRGSISIYDKVEFSICYGNFMSEVTEPAILYKFVQDKYHLREEIAWLIRQEHIYLGILSSLHPIYGANLIVHYKKLVREIRLKIREKRRAYEQDESHSFEIYLFFINRFTRELKAINVEDIIMIYDRKGKKQDLKWMVEKLLRDDLFEKLDKQCVFYDEDFDEEKYGLC